MTTATTVAAVFVLFNCAIFAAYVITFPIEIVRMTGGTERCVLIPPIVDNFIIINVTGPTADIRTVVSRIVTERRMGEIDWRPALSRMTVVTLRTGNKVIVPPLGFAANRGYAVMTRRATFTYPLMIKGASGKGRSGVTKRAIQCSRNVIG